MDQKPIGTPDAGKAELKKLNDAKRVFFLSAAAVCCIVLLYVLGYALEVLSVPVGILIWTVIIVFCLRGIVASLEAKGISRSVGTAIAYAIMAVVLLVIIGIMSSPVLGIGEQFQNLVESIPGYINAISDWANNMYVQYEDVLNNDTMRQYLNDALASVAVAAQEAMKQSATGVVAVGSGIANAGMVIGFALVVAYWILMELPLIGAEFKRLMGPRYQEDLDMLHVTLTRVLGGYIRATLLQCAIIGAACLILFMILQIPNFAALGVITGLLNIIPVVGPWIGGAVAALIALMVSPLDALIVLVGTIIIQQFVYTFVSPRLMADSVDVHPALTLIALMAGSAIGGAMGGLTGSIFGMLVSIPAVAVARALFIYYFEKATGRKLVSEQGVFFKGTPSEGDDVNPISDATSPHPQAAAMFAPITISAPKMPTDKIKAIKIPKKDDSEKTSDKDSQQPPQQ